MEFYPTNQIIICKGVCLDPSYKHTLTFSTESAQENYFLNKKKFVVDDASYTRATGRIKIKKNAEQLWDCSYLMFQNRDYGSKWFYAFITDVLFLSESSSEISFQIDVVQTWYFDYNIQSCFVEREHTNNDAIGANTLPEGLELGDYVVYSAQKIDVAADGYEIIIATTFDAAEKPGGMMWQKVFSGVIYLAYPATNAGAEQVNAFIEQMTTLNKVDSIIAIFQLPSFIVNQSTQNIALNGPTGSFGGYTPINNKLRTFPYCCMGVTNHQGQENTYKYELWNTSDKTFRMTSALSMASKIIFTPTNYKQIDYNIEESIMMDSFPQCSWKSSVFDAWFASRQYSIRTGFFNQGINLVGNVAEGNVGGALSGLQQILNSVAQITDVSTVPPTIHGLSNNDSANITWDIVEFEAKHYTIRAEYARVIDNFFSMFGYKTNRVKVPNITGRSSWNYVKTINSTVCGNCPGTVLREVEEILNNGITYWHGDYVGDYSRSNSII